MNKFLRLFLGILWVLSFSCGCTYQVGNDQTDEDDMAKSIIGAQLTDMSRTLIQGSAGGQLPIGTPNRGLMQTDLEPGEYTIQFSVIPPSDNRGFAAYAIVNWKVGGHQLRRVVSVASGAVISGVADAVDVQIVDVSDGPVYAALPSGNPDPKQLYQVASTLSRGSRPSLNQPGVLLTSRSALQVAPVGGLQIWSVPQDCGVISAYISGPVPTLPDVAADIIVQFNDAAGVTLGFATIGPSSWTPVPSGTVQVLITNNGVNTYPVNVIWGIDG
jgi:hypothetical protein